MFSIKRISTFIVLLSLFATVVTGRYALEDGPGILIIHFLAVLVSVTLMTMIGLIVCFATLWVHEFGHLVFGRLQGFRLDLLAVGPFAFRQDRHQKVRCRVDGASLVGFVKMIPLPGDHLRARLFLMLAGGPLASLALQAALVVLVNTFHLPTILSLGRKPPIPDIFTAVFVTIALYLNICILLGSLLPYRVRRMGGAATDGLAMLQLLWRGPVSDRTIVLAEITGRLQSGEPVKTLPVDLVEASHRRQDSTYEEVIALTIACEYWLHQDFERAEPLVRRLAIILADRGQFLRTVCGTPPWLMVALYEAIVNLDPNRSRAWVESAGTPGHPADRTLQRVCLTLIADLEGAANRDEYIQSARKHVEDARQRTFVDWSFEIAMLEHLERGGNVQSLSKTLGGSRA